MYKNMQSHMKPKVYPFVLMLAVSLAFVFFAGLHIPARAYAEPAQGLTASTGDAAQSSTFEGVYTLTNVNSKKRLNVSDNGVKKGTNVNQASAEKSAAQYFSFRYDKKTGYYVLLSVHSGLALSVSKSSKKSGANVELATYSKSLSQRWSLKKNKDGSYTVRNAASKMALSVANGSKKSGANVRQYAGNNAAQHWKLQKVTNWLPNGVYNFVTANNTANALVPAKKSTAAGARLQSAKRSDVSWPQAWVVMHDSANPGYYTIRNMNSRLYLSVKNASAQSGAAVVQAKYSSVDARLWRPELSYGGIIWRSKLDNKLVLAMSGGGKKAGTKVEISTRGKSYAQKFRLKREAVKTLVRSSSFYIRNNESNLVLDIAGASNKSGARVQLTGFSKSNSQKFRFSPNGKGYSIVNAKSGKSVWVDTKTKKKITQQKLARKINQRWTLNFDYITATFTITSSYTGKQLDGASGTLSQRDASSAASCGWIFQPTTSDYFRVFLNAGHGWNSNGNGAFDTGALGLNGEREADYTSDLCDRIIKYARDTYGIDIIDSRPYKLAYWDRLSKAKKLGCSVIFSVHFDAGGGSGPMPMVGVNGRHKNSVQFSNIMSKHLFKALPGLPHRNLSYRNDITCVNGSIPAVLVEVCFMDNPSDLRYYNARKNTVAKELAAGLYEASQKPDLRKKV